MMMLNDLVRTRPENGIDTLSRTSTRAITDENFEEAKFREFEPDNMTVQEV